MVHIDMELKDKTEILPPGNGPESACDGKIHSTESYWGKIYCRKNLD